jgi:multidrug efflux pump subunit AcrA (membrane-fusion protein)
MGAKGALQPIERAEIFAPMGGEVIDVLKDNGDAVAANEPLVKLRNPELAVKVRQIEGEYNAALQQLNGIRQQLTSDRQKMTEIEFKRLESDFAKVKVQVDSLNKQLDLVHKREEQLVVRSPIAGRVITWDVRRTLQNRPVEVGQVLMTVAAEDTDYRVELYMPERKMKHVMNYRQSLREGDPNADLRVDFILMTDPGVTHYGTVTEIHGATETHDEHGNMVRIYVKPDEQIVNPRPGASVSGNVYCGKAPLLWAWFHEAWEAAQANIFFPWT